MSRRRFLRGLAGILSAGVAPYVVTTSGVLMPVRKLWTPSDYRTGVFEYRRCADGMFECIFDSRSIKVPYISAAALNGSQLQPGDYVRLVYGPDWARLERGRL